MHRQHDRKSYGTVRWTGREGLLKEKLRGGETVRAGRKQAGRRQKKKLPSAVSGEGRGFPDTATTCPDGIRQDIEKNMAGLTADRQEMPVPAYERRKQPFNRKDAGERHTEKGGDFGTDKKTAPSGPHDRKKQQVYAHARKEKQQKRTEEGAASSFRRKGERSEEKGSGCGKLYEGQEKKASRLSFGEADGMAHGIGMRLTGRKAFQAAGKAASGLLRDGSEEQREDMETEFLYRAGRTGDRASRCVMRLTSSRMQKRNLRTEENISETARKKEQKKFYQKQWNRKTYAETMRKKKTVEGPMKAAESFWEKTKRIAAEVFRKKRGICGAVIPLFLFFIVFAAGLSSCSAMVQGASSTFIGTTYPSRDEEIYDAEDGYRELEEALDEQIDHMESAHPGYDEYRYQVDEITHNPYQLISFLTVLYEEFTCEQIRDILPVLFAEQYRLTTEEIVETRTRTEIQTVTDPLTGEESERETEVEYEWHILCICLTNKGFDTVARSRMTPEQTKHYAAYNMTYGNRSYLFDVGGLPVDGSDGSGYEIPAEALSDEQFARMIQEAEKYLGRSYVWGGASPETGFDCSGFVSWVINNSGNGWDVGRQTAEGLRGSCTAVAPVDAEPGDLIFFQGTYNTSGASHVGIYAGNGMMIHAGNPVKYSNINTPYWQEHFLSYGRVG